VCNEKVPWYVLPSSSTSYDSITSWMASPTSHRRTSIPAFCNKQTWNHELQVKTDKNIRVRCVCVRHTLIPVLVASFTASSSLSYFGLNVTVKAQSMIRPESTQRRKKTCFSFSIQTSAEYQQSRWKMSCWPLFKHWQCVQKKKRHFPIPLSILSEEKCNDTKWYFLSQYIEVSSLQFVTA